MTPHPDSALLRKFFRAVRLYHDLASKHGISDIFQDNGGKILQVPLLVGLRPLPSREGDDAVDENGNQYGLKSVNIDLTRSFSTHHHMNPAIIAKYRCVNWIFAVYQGIELQKTNLTTPGNLEPYYQRGHDKWHADDGKDIYNPKIPLKFVEENGALIYESLPAPEPEEIALLEAQNRRNPPSGSRRGAKAQRPSKKWSCGALGSLPSSNQAAARVKSRVASGSAVRSRRSAK